MREILLGKINNVKLGFIPDTPLFGMVLTFSLDGGNLFISNGCELSFNASEHSKYSKWTPEDQKNAAAHMIFKIISYMNDAKISDISKLIGIPVEVIIEKNTFVDFRILTEVL